MKLCLAVAVIVCVFGVSLASGDYRGSCKTAKLGHAGKCTKYGFYNVKQCHANADLCQCVDAWDGTLVSRVEKEDECPPCLLANADSYKMTAEGYMDMNVYRCASDGHYDDESVQCMWFACFCYNRDGTVAHTLTTEERGSTDFSCKSV